MEELQVDASPRALSRIGGVLYLIIIVRGIFGEAFVRNRLIVVGRCNGHRRQHQVDGVAVALRHCCRALHADLRCALGWIFFVLLRPVSRDLALLVVFFNLVSIALEAANELQLLAALFPLGNAGYLRAFEPEQLYAMASLSSNRMAMALASA